MTRSSTGVALLLLVNGCSGALVIQEPRENLCETSADCGLDQICDTANGECIASPGPCSPEHLSGDCPLGLECNHGDCICVDPEVCGCDGVCPTEWCPCTPEQGCDGLGRCFDIVTTDPGANNCAPAIGGNPGRPDGLCPGGTSCCEDGKRCCLADEVCVANHCVPNDHPCSTIEPNGWCPYKQTCIGGRCVPLVSCECDADNVHGCCPNGESCNAGECVDAPCSSESFGACEQDWVCEANGCQQLECSTTHVDGACPAQTPKCSDAGVCIPNNTCRVNTDCNTASEYCSATETCFANGTCAVGFDADCEIGQATTYGQGYRCTEEGECEERTTCTNGDDLQCRPGKFCSGLGHCLTPPNCDVREDCGEEEFCPASGQCTNIDRCTDDIDCEEIGPGLFCASNDKCIPYLTCAALTDCPDGHVCNNSPGELGTCIVDPAADTCTDNPAPCDPSGATSTSLTCCTSGDCCPLQRRCSEDGVCMSDRACVTDDDCLAGFSVCEHYVCVPTVACTGETCAAAGQHCITTTDAEGNYVSGCVPTGRCLDDTGCGNGEFCNATYNCEADATCGANFLTVGSAVQPNVMIVFDRSGSMNICGAGRPSAGNCGYLVPCTNDGGCNDKQSGFNCYNPGGGTNQGVCECSEDSECGNGFKCIGSELLATACNSANGDADCAAGQICSTVSNTCAWPGNCECDAGMNGEKETRLEVATSAIDSVLGEFRSRINFGLSILPSLAGAMPCPRKCDWFSCPDNSNLTPGIINVPVNCNTIFERACKSTGGCTWNAGSATCEGGASCAHSALCDAVTGCTWVNGSCQPDDIVAILQNAPPGGSTPTGQTLRSLVADPGAAGLNAPDRANAVLLVTDGEAAGDWPGAGRYCESHCSNGSKDGTETEIDCGGLCKACVVPTNEALPLPSCKTASDCDTNLCRGGYCRPASCGNGAQDANETGLDCGGRCWLCGDGQACNNASDCGSGVCGADNRCQAPSCLDTKKNGDETDVDCGGATCDKCTHPTSAADSVQNGCRSDTDCVSGICQDGKCRPTECRNSSQDSGAPLNETDVDCGGSCGRCTDGKGCQDGDDCLSGNCSGGHLCFTPTCANGVKDGDETDIDCGGSCPACLPGRMCSNLFDCQGGNRLSLTVLDKAVSAGDQVQIIRNGVTTTLTEGTDPGDDFNCAGVASNDLCALNLLAAIAARVPSDVTPKCTPPNCSNAVISFTWEATVTALDVQVLDNAHPNNPYDLFAAPASSCVDCKIAPYPTDSACRVNGAIDRLYTLDPSVRTFVVGFNFGGTSANLNCHATHGKTPLRTIAGCENINPDTCSTATAACYYKADNASELLQAFRGIIDQVSACSYPIDHTPQAPGKVFAYLETVSGPLVRTRLEQFTTWDYDIKLNRVDFYGDACDKLKAGTHKPIFIEGCPEVGY